MILSIAQFIEKYFDIETEQSALVLRRIAVVSAAVLFLVIGTTIVAFDSIFSSTSMIASLDVGDEAPTDIYAPRSISYTSEVLTEQLRQEARANVEPIYRSADLSVARNQSALAGRILDYIDNVRRDPYATQEQKIQDIRAITALSLAEDLIIRILEMSPETWTVVDAEVRSLIEQVMQDSIRETDVPDILDRLPNQVSLRFDTDDVEVITAIVGDLVRPNRSIDAEATAQRQQEAMDQVAEQIVSLQSGQLVIQEGGQIEAVHIEAFNMLGLLQPADQRIQNVVSAMLAMLLSMVIIGYYLSRFHPVFLYQEPRLLVLISVIFLMTLAGARLALAGDQIYLYPASVMAMLFVSITHPQIAIMGTVVMSFLIGVMAGYSFEAGIVVLLSGLMAVLALRREERLNHYFYSGILLAVIVASVGVMFTISLPVEQAVSRIPILLAFSIVNGVLSAALSLIGMYLFGQLFNIPTAVRLIELSQPNNALLQRLLREAPGTYTHSLQVANLAEQAATAIGANAQLVQVAALYHDIGKMKNPAFFTENQRDMVRNPHDTLNDPYRSADIIINHVIDGDEMARKARLPNRMRDFIREHHGTTETFVFYQQALALAGDDKDAVDVADFTYPGPKPRSRETAILMLADSCEAAVRAIRPESTAQLEETINKIIDGKIKAKQLNDSGLTLNELHTIKQVFIDILQAMFHPRINYAKAVENIANKDKAPEKTEQPVPTPPVSKPKETKTITPTKDVTVAINSDEISALDEDDDSPLPEVPHLPRSNGIQQTQDGKTEASNADENTSTEDEVETSSESQVKAPEDAEK